ncbi:hypothetical protein [Limnohabitans sp.]|uniref:hypothetical protein n=1 Tax=Limnohabitans sp. TaxID=1907725 RepID=UPI0039BD6204|nr:hypothetical protein [Comamonadaceae bacterium]
MKLNRKKISSKLNLPLLGIGALLVEQAVASYRTTVENPLLQLSETGAALGLMGSDQSAVSGEEISEQLSALNALVQSELALVSGGLEDVSIGLMEGLDFFSDENPASETLALDGSDDQGMGQPILLAQTDAFRETLTDQPHPVLAQLSQGAPQAPTPPSAGSQLADQAFSLGGVEGLSWPVVGGAIAGVALVAASGSSSAGQGAVGGGDQGAVGGGDQGVVGDGYISGAIVFRDLNGNDELDADEFSVVTDALGNYSGLGGVGGTIVAYGGTDISTGLKFQGILKAPSGSAVINPLTTLVEALVGDTTGMSPSEIAALVTAAELRVAKLLGLDENTSITQTDPIALAQAGGAGALAMQLAALQVANILVTLSQSIGGSAADASLLMSKAFADLINSLAADGTLDLADLGFISGLFSSLVSPEAAAQAAAALAAVNAYIAAIDPNAGLDGLKQAVAAQLVIVGEGGLLTAVAGGVGVVFDVGDLDERITDNLEKVKDVSGGGSSVTWNISKDIDAYSSDAGSVVTDAGTVNLDTSLSALAGMGIDIITGNNGTSVVIQGGIGDIDLNDPGLRFADGKNGERNLSVTVDVTDDAENGTVNLNTSLSALDAMGIDTITGNAGTSVLIQGGIGGLDLGATDLSFTDSGENDLDVTLQLTDADQNADTGTVNLNTSLSALDAMGIDTISGEAGTSVLIQGGIGELDLAATDMSFADSGESDLDVTLQTDLNDLGTVNLNTNLSALAGMGIDTINLNNSLSQLAALSTDRITGEDGTSLVIQGGMDGFDLDATDLSFADGGTNDLNVTLDVTDDIENGTVNLSTSLSALSAMGIDTITGEAGTSVLIQGGSEMTLSDIMGLGMSFDNDLDVTLSIGDADALADFGLTDADLQADSSFMLGNSEAATALKDMGIDFINGDGVSGVWTEQDDD